MNIVKWFDPHNIQHIKAYQQLQKTGDWPDWVFTEMKDRPYAFPDMWYVKISAKLADAWLEYALDKENW